MQYILPNLAYTYNFLRSNYHICFWGSYMVQIWNTCLFMLPYKLGTVQFI